MMESVGMMKFPTVSGKSFKIPWFQTTKQMIMDCHGRWGTLHSPREWREILPIHSYPNSPAGLLGCSDSSSHEATPVPRKTSPKIRQKLGVFSWILKTVFFEKSSFKILKVQNYHFDPCCWFYLFIFQPVARAAIGLASAHRGNSRPDISDHCHRGIVPHQKSQWSTVN